MTTPHTWKLVAPWYRWQRQLAQNGWAPPQTHPVFQKFDVPDFVQDFVAEPQHSLVFKDDIDQVFAVNATPVRALTSGPLAGKITRLFSTAESGPQDVTLVPTGLRKLFLETHKRYYLVVCELHCDAPGFPTATADQVCQAGFVVRRRSSAYPGGLLKEAKQRLNGLVALQAQIAYLEQTAPARGPTAARRERDIDRMKAAGTYDTRLTELRARLADARQELVLWKSASGAVPVLEGWVPTRFKNVGAWQVVDETPQDVTEASFPLYQLFPSPTDPEHSAQGKNIYYGVVPTSGHDVDANGNARFDSRSRYEIRCFVRRHKAGCPRLDVIPDCHGPLFWSEATEPYQLAAPADLIGTSQRPVTIQMPDLAELAAQATALPLNKFSPMKVQKPQQLNFDVSDGKASNGRTSESSQVCFFAIPLITLVAFFVFSLFLPILVFLFNLYFLLAFRLCIPPSVSIGGGLKTDIDALPPGVDVDAGLSVSAATNLNKDVKIAIALDAGIPGKAPPDSPPPVIPPDLDSYSNVPLLPLGQRLMNAAAVPAGQGDGYGVDVTGALEYEPVVEVTS
jgi:hypothetical protein